MGDGLALVLKSLMVAGVAAVVVGLVLAVVVRLGKMVLGDRRNRSWRRDLRPVWWVMALTLVVTFVVMMRLQSAFSDVCETSQVNEVLSPDRRHKVEVYAFDCGRTTDFTLVVSLLGAGESLPKNKTADRLYERYRMAPVAEGPEENFAVLWGDVTHVTVRVKGFEGVPDTQLRDGVSVTVDRLP